MSSGVGPVQLPALGSLLEGAITVTPSPTAYGPAPLPAIAMLFVVPLDTGTVVPSDSNLYAGQLFSGLMFAGQLWAQAREDDTGGGGGGGGSPTPTDPWTRIDRDTQTWTPV